MIAPIGNVTVVTSGTPVQVSSILSAGTLRRLQSIHAIQFQANPANTGRIYVGNSGMNIATLAGLFGIVATPTLNTSPSWTAAHTISPNGLSLLEFWVDADINGDSCIVTILQT